MSATHEQLLWAEVGQQAVDAAGDTWTKAQDGLWEMYDPELGKNIYLTSYQLHHVWSPLGLLPVPPVLVFDPATSKQNPNGHVAYVGEDGQLHDLGAAVLSTDFSWSGTPVEAATKAPTSYSTELRFTRVDPVNKAQQKLWLQLLAGSPRAELRDRLNARLRGDDLGKPINWKGL